MHTKIWSDHDSVSYPPSAMDFLPVERLRALQLSRLKATLQRTYEKVKNFFRLDASMLEGVKPNMKILHPLPRINEIATDVDDTPYAYFYKQAENGMYVRMAIIAYLLGYK